MAYDHQSIEAKWQRRWHEAGVHKTGDDRTRPKYYVLDMFPYPSGAGLHVGHCEGYTATDIIARYKRMRGWNVLHPFGWDAFGLPAENYAIKTGVHPRITTARAVDRFRRQLKSLGFCYDWDREIDTTDPRFYRWTQWIFLKLYERGLAYQAVAPINWCASCRTGLANEEVTAGRCERCGSQVGRKNLRQWMLRITEYADRLLKDLDGLDWPESTLQMQRHWIGRTEGAELTFDVADGPLAGTRIAVYTTRPDTVYGATYLALAPEHPLTAMVATAAQSSEVAAYVEAASNRNDDERSEANKAKSGVFTGSHARHPISGERIPIWVAQYVLATYGTGALMGVPAHDERDYNFAVRFALPIRRVVRPLDEERDVELPFTGDGISVDSPAVEGLLSAEARHRVVALSEREGFGKAAVRYRLRDWVFSRQRYWGEPIPIVHCAACGAVPLPESELPLRLPDVERYEPSGTGESPLATIREWLAATCPRCAAPARRETNTMPQWAGSCWYYLRYLDPRNDVAPWSPEQEQHWMDVDLYVGGAEHAVRHLFYARFWHKVLFDLGLVSTVEPFRRLRHQGIVLAASYRDSLGRYYPWNEVDAGSRETRLRATGERLVGEVEKMAKSKLNGVDPNEVIREYGADSLRLYEMFMGDFELSKPWDPRAIEGCSRFLKRIWRLVASHASETAPHGDLHARMRHQAIRKVQADIEQMKFNTAIAALMQYVGALTQYGATFTDLETLIKLVGPFAPHLGDEAWHCLHGEAGGFLIAQEWPEYDELLARSETVTVVVQVDGRLRGRLEVERDLDDEQLRTLALALSNVREHVRDKRIDKVVVVKNRIVSVVTRH